MTTDELTYRAAAVEAGVDHSRIEDGVYSDSEQAAIRNTLKKNADLYSRIHVIDPAFVGAEELHGLGGRGYDVAAGGKGRDSIS